MVGLTKSVCISLALILGEINVKEAYFLAFSEEIYQIQNNGEVEGDHDVNKFHALGKLGSCTNFINFLQINKFN